MIEKMLSREAATALFEQEAVLFGTVDAIPEYRIVELFGEQAGVFMEKTMGGPDAYLVAGRDFSFTGAGSPEQPVLDYIYKSGFFKIVSDHNYRVAVKRHKESAGGRVMDALWEARSARIAAEDAEEERKAQERREKRAAAKAANKKKRGQSHERAESGAG